MTGTPTSRLDRALGVLVPVVVALMPTQIGVPVLKLGRAAVTLTVADVALWVLAACLVGQWLARRRRTGLRLPPPQVWLIAGVALLSTSAWLEPGASRQGLLTTLKETLQIIGFFVVAPSVFLNAFRDPETRRRSVWAWLAVTGVVSALGFVQALAAQAGTSGTWLFFSRHLESEPLPVDPGNVVGLFGSRTIYGAYIALSLPMLLATALSVRSPALLAGAAAVAFLGAASIAAPGPFAAVAIGLCVAGLLAEAKPAHRTPGIVLAALIVGCALIAGPFRWAKLDWHLSDSLPQTVTEMVRVPVRRESTVRPLPEVGRAPTQPSEQPAPTSATPPTVQPGASPRPAPPPSGGLGPSPGLAPGPAVTPTPTPGPGESPAPPDNQLELAPGEAPAPPDEELETAPGMGLAPELWTTGAEAITASPSRDGPQGPSARFREVPVQRTVVRPVLRRHFAEWGAAVNMLGSLTRPIAAIGAGPGQYQEAIGGYYGAIPKDGKLEPDMQSQYLVFACDLGLGGLFALAYFMVSLGVGVGRGLAREGNGWDRGILAGAAGTLAALVLLNLFGCTIVRGTGVTVALFASLICATQRTTGKGEPADE